MFGTAATPSQFLRNDRGNVGILFGLTLIIMVGLAGMAIDTGRAVQAKGAIGSAIDAAALAGAKGLRLQGLTATEAAAVAQKVFDTNMQSHGGQIATVQSVTIAVDTANVAVSIDVQATVPTLLAQVISIDTIDIPVATTAIFDSKDIEVGMQLDMTGSMASATATGTKISDLRTATKNFVDTLILDTPTPQKVRIGFAPFTSGVNAGAYIKAVDGNRASTGCTYERLSAFNQTSDATPFGQDAMKIQADLPGANGCPAPQVIAMTDDKALLKATADTFSPGGSTAGHLGAAWAWYLISPNWSGIWPSASKPAPYNDGKTIKVAVLMTDGEYNTIGGISSNSYIATSSKLAVDTCNNMKAQGIIVYTVGFQVGGNALALDTLTKCASEPGKFLRAEDGNSLHASFASIANDINTLRLSR